MNRQTLYTIAVCSVALALGAAVGNLHSASNAAPQSLEPAARPSSAATPSPERAEIFAKAVREETGAKRWLALISAAEHATAADMPGFIRLAGKDDAMLHMLAAHWAELDPKHMLATLYADALLPFGSADKLPGNAILRDVLLEEWTKNDLAGAVAAMRDVPDFSMRGNFRRSLANSVLQTDLERGLQLMSEWKTGFTADAGKIAAWAARDPHHAADVVVPLSGSYGGSDLLKEIGKAWAKGDPAAGLKYAARLASGSRANLGVAIIEGWAERDLAAAVAYAEAEPDANRAALAAGLVATWQKTDPTAALDWSLQNLKGNTRNEVIENLVKTIAEKDLTAAGELIVNMPPGGAQNRATTVLFETWAKKGANEREAALDWLASVPDADARREAIDRFGWTWGIGDPAGVRDFIAGPHGDMASSHIVNTIAWSQGQANPEATLAWANSLPADRRQPAILGAVRAWTESRPEGAMQYARALPAGAERSRAIETVSEYLAYASAERAAQGLRDLPHAEQKIAREIFDRAQLPDDRRKQLDAALK